MKSMKQLMAITMLSASASWAQGQGIGGAVSSDPFPAPAAGPSVKASPRTGAAPLPNMNVYGQSMISEYGSGYGYAKSSGSSVPPVVIQFSGNNPGAIAEMESHLEVMTHIIDRALERMGENIPDERMGIRIVYTGGKSVRALYLENFGPLFMVKVNFPVHAPGTTETKAPDPEEDSEWNQAWRSLYGQADDVRWSHPGVPYEAERVEALKKQLVAAVKNASNMKGVKPDEYVTVTVFGSPALAGDNVESRSRRTVSGRGGGGGGVGGSIGSGLPRQSQAANEPTRPVPSTTDRIRDLQKLESARTALQGTVLTLRVKKSDIDASANGSEDALMKKVAINTYSGNGHGVSSVNSWIRSSSSSGLQAR